MKKKTKRNIFAVIALDLIMIIILVFNFTWIIFDWTFELTYVKNILQTYATSFYDFYVPIHQHFWFYDLIFVGIYVIELITRWITAAIRRTYYKWFFYPFIHWYDVLGLVPVGSFLILRFLRVISIFYRLYKLEIIDITKTYIYQSLNKYYHILVEEISDRVVVNVLNDLQTEFKDGAPMLEKIVDETIKPYKTEIVSSITTKIQMLAQTTLTNYESDLQEYIRNLVSYSMFYNPEFNRISKIPLLGKELQKSIEIAISQTMFEVLRRIVKDLSRNKNDLVVNHIVGSVFDQMLDDFKKDMHKISQDVIIDALEIIKNQVKIQQWKLREIDEKMQKLDGMDDEKSQKRKDKLQKLKQEAVIRDPLFRFRQKKKKDESN